MPGVQTLERHDSPISSRFATNPVASLSTEDVEQFERDGFLGPIDVLDATQLAAVRHAVDGVIARLGELAPHLYEVEQAHAERPDEVVCHFLGGWLIDEVLHDLIFHAGATAPLARLLGVEELRFWHDQVFAKPPRHPGVVPWHQDYSYWTRTGPARHITINIALDDTSVENGCLHFVRGSHRWGLMPMVPFDANLEAIRAHLPDGAEFEPVPVPARAGQATIHHSHTLHGSPANRTDGWRRAAVLNYMASDTRCMDGSAPLLRGTPVVPEGEIVEGPHFPIVWPLRGTP